MERQTRTGAILTAIVTWGGTLNSAARTQPGANSKPWLERINRHYNGDMGNNPGKRGKFKPRSRQHGSK